VPGQWSWEARWGAEVWRRQCERACEWLLLLRLLQLVLVVDHLLLRMLLLLLLPELLRLKSRHASVPAILLRGVPRLTAGPRRMLHRIGLVSGILPPGLPVPSMRCGVLLLLLLLLGPSICGVRIRVAGLLCAVLLLLIP